MSKRQFRRRLTAELDAIGLDDVGLRIDLDFRQGVIENQVGLANRSSVFCRDKTLGEVEVIETGLESGLANEGNGRGGLGSPMGGELGTVVHGLRRGNGGVGISHVGAGDKAPARAARPWR